MYRWLEWSFTSYNSYQKVFHYDMLQVHPQPAWRIMNKISRTNQVIKVLEPFRILDGVCIMEGAFILLTTTISNNNVKLGVMLILLF